MALTIKIDHDEANASDLAEYLKYVAVQIDKGFTSGDPGGWDVTGVDEDSDEEDDFSGPTLDDGEGR